MIYPDDFINKIIHGDCLEVMKDIEDKSIDMILTSPPYDNLRDYNGYTFDFESIAKELYRIVKVGGVVVWIVNDQTVKGSETGTSFRQALYFKEIGFNIHDTMIWNKNGFSGVGSLKVRYCPVFEYMFVFVKGKLKTFNPIKDKINANAGRIITGTNRHKDGTLTKFSCYGNKINEYGQRYNIWQIPQCVQRGNNKHPAPFPEQLANDHIISWSNENDIIYDPMCGSGTTCKMALVNNRRYIGSDISKEYCELAEKRINQVLTK